MEIRRIHTPHRHWVTGFLTEVAAFLLYLGLLCLVAGLTAAWL